MPITDLVQVNIMSSIVAHQSIHFVPLTGLGHVKILAHRSHTAALLVPKCVIPAAVEALELLVPLEAVPAGEVRLTAICPGQLRGKASKCVVDCPSNDHVVINDNQEGNHQHAIAQPFKCWSNPAKQLDGSLPCILTKSKLKEEERQPRDEQHSDIGYQECHACK